jgi:catechol 2,3-dioxygenase-like lactoylglutathione lyase family enzyme
MGRVIDHVDIRVSDRDTSRRFYDTVLTVLGKERTDYPEYSDWGDFSIVADGQPVAKHLHIAFYAPSHELVDAFHRAGVEAGYTNDGAPGPRPRYREDYYGGFLRDPDGNSVDKSDHVQILTANASISYVAGEPLTEHVHFAFGVDTNEAVDAFHRAAIDAGYTDNGAPGERAVYHPGYYGAFVLDPDGHNIEAVNHNRAGAS